MTFLQSILLGIVQGLTEFLPVSSSAHLVLVPYLLNWKIPQAQIFPFDVLVQLGTLLAVILYFWQDIVNIIKAFFKGLIDKEPFKDPLARQGWYLIIATIPAGILGVTIKSKVEAAFNSPTLTALFLFVTAALLIVSDLVSKRNRTQEEMTWFDALWIGLFQGISLFPGISRSGSTIAGGMTRNFDRSTSARFSFLMSIPAMLGAGLVSLKDLSNVPDLANFLPVLMVGFIAAAIVGYLSIHWLLSFIKKQKFWVFAIYCVVFASLVLLAGAIRSGSTEAAAITPTTPPLSATANSTALPAQTVEVDATPSGLIQPIQLDYTASLNWLLPAISTCADAFPDVHLITHQLPTSDLNTHQGNILLRWGAPAQLDSYSARLASDSLALIVHPQNPLESLTTAAAQKVFDGEITTWGQLHDACPDCFNKAYDENTYKEKPVALGFYPQEEDIQNLFNQTIMNGQPVASASALLLPDVDAMLETIGKSTTAIGFVPTRALGTSVKEIKLSDADVTRLSQPILAIAASEPQGSARDWLLCLQKVLNP